MSKPDYPTMDVAKAINEVLSRNHHTIGLTVREMAYTTHYFVAALREWKTIDGECVDVPRRDNEADLFDLMNDYQEGRQ